MKIQVVITTMRTMMMLMIMMMIMDVGTCLSFIEKLPFTRVGVVDLQLLCYAGCCTLHSQDPKAKEAPTLSKTYSSAPTTPKKVQAKTLLSVSNNRDQEMLH